MKAKKKPMELLEAAKLGVDLTPRSTVLSVAEQVKSSQVANPRNAFCIEQRTAAKSKEAQVRVFGLFLLLPRLAPVGLIAR